MISPDYSKRGYLLPEGCKDLIDVIRLQALEKASGIDVPWRVEKFVLELPGLKHGQFWWWKKHKPSK